MLATAKDQSKVKLGNNMIVAGLFVQILFFGFFIVVSVVFHRRMLATPMHAAGDTRIPGPHPINLQSGRICPGQWRIPSKQRGIHIRI